jgi:hypothetical protein
MFTASDEFMRCWLCIRLPLLALVAFVRAASRRVTRGKCSTIAPFLALLSIPVGQCHGDWTFIGPTPYRSTADSPFPISINPNFFVETFEDGLLNTRGIVQKNPFPLPGTGGLAFVRLPGQNTDSVDGDDGLVDGLGLGGDLTHDSWALQGAGIMLAERRRIWVAGVFRRSSSYRQ